MSILEMTLIALGYLGFFAVTGLFFGIDGTQGFGLVSVENWTQQGGLSGNVTNHGRCA